MPQSTLVFIALAAAIGAMLLISGNIDPRATVRAQFTLTPSQTFTPSITPTPVDPFADIRYEPWTSPDEIVQMEKPASWLGEPTPTNGPVAYVFTHPDAPDTGMLVAVLPTSQIQPLAGLPEDASPRDMFSALVPPDQQGELQDVTFGQYPGVSLRDSRQDVDPLSGQAIDNQSVMWLVKLGPGHILLLQGVSSTANWEKMEESFHTMRGTLEIDVEGAIARLDEALGPPAVPTSPSTQQATAEPTDEATAEPTSAATPEPAAPTRTPTPTPGS